MTRLSSKAYLAGSKGAACTFRIPEVCTNNPETVVPCHLRDGHTGRGVKASDISVANGCLQCHDRMDGRSGTLSREDWLFYALRGLQETLEQRVEAGLLGFPHDKAKEHKPAVRKPKAQRKSIPKRVNPWGK